MNLVVSRAQIDELSQIRLFYTQVGYVNTNNIKESDDIFVARNVHNKIIGTVRLVYENNVRVLRGMQVHPDYQRQGVGSQLLYTLEKDITDVCYCLAHEWLELFYGKISFKRITDADLPSFLQQRLLKYRTTEYPKLIALRRT